MRLRMFNRRHRRLRNLRNNLRRRSPVPGLRVKVRDREIVSRGDGEDAVRARRCDRGARIVFQCGCEGLCIEV